MAAIGFPAETRARHACGWAWWSVLATVTIALILSGGKRTVVHNYLAAGTAWRHGQPLYDDSGAGFIYLPHTAIAFAPLSGLAPAAAEAVWRVLALGLFASGVYRFCRVVESRIETELFLTTTLVTLPLSWSAAQNGQATLPMAGFMLHAIADTAQRRWGRAAICLWIAVGIKPLAVVALLLIGAAYPKTRRPLALGGGLFVAFPFLCQAPTYVWGQVSSIPSMLAAAGQGGQAEYWAQFFGMLEVAGMSTSRLLQTLIRMTAALGTLTCVLWCVRRRSLPTNVVMLYTLTAAYIMLMSPRTENNTYAMLAPAIGILLTIEADLLRRRRLAWLLLGIALGTVGSFEIGRLFVAREKAIWLAPFMAVLLLAYAIDFLAQERFEGTTTLAENQANPESRLPNVSERSAA